MGRHCYGICPYSIPAARPRAGANLSAWWLLPAKAKALGGMLGVGATGGACGLALTALALAARPTPGFLVAAAAFAQLALAPLLAAPVPGVGAGAASVGLPVGVEGWGAWVWGAWRAGGRGGVAAALRGCVAEPGLSWCVCCGRVRMCVLCAWGGGCGHVRAASFARADVRARAQNGHPYDRFTAGCGARWLLWP